MCPDLSEEATVIAALGLEKCGIGSSSVRDGATGC